MEWAFGWGAIALWLLLALHISFKASESRKIRTVLHCGLRTEEAGPRGEPTRFVRLCKATSFPFPLNTGMIVGMDVTGWSHGAMVESVFVGEKEIIAYLELLVVSEPGFDEAVKGLKTFGWK